jgi:glucosyl-3-phosphoglycerate synthase
MEYLEYMDSFRYPLAGEAFLDRPMERPFIPSWNRVMSAVPDILDQLLEAVEADHAEFAAGHGS